MITGVSPDKVVFRCEAMARELARLTRRMTGDQTRLVNDGVGIWHVYRWTGSEWYLV